MAQMDESDRRFRDIGSIIGWLQSIEFMLRWWLTKREGGEIEIPSHVGQVMKKTPLTDYRSLTQLMKAYNSQLTSDEAKYKIEPQVVEIRDGLAHGRVLAIEGEDFLTLYRFSEPQGNKVRATVMKALTADQLTGEQNFLREQYDRLLSCGTGRGYFY